MTDAKIEPVFEKADIKGEEFKKPEPQVALKARKYRVKTRIMFNKVELNIGDVFPGSDDDVKAIIDYGCLELIEE